MVVVSLGRGGELTEFPPDVPPLDLPEAGQLTAVDFMALQLPVNLVGYHTQSVDETLRRAANAISARDTRIAVLEQRVSELLASRLQARQEAYAGSSVTPRTEHHPDAPSLALPEDGSPAGGSQPYARVGHQPTGDDTEAGQQQNAPEDFDGSADETRDPGQNGQSRTDTSSALTSDESSASFESSMDADRAASAEAEAVRWREGTTDNGTVAPTWGRTAPSEEDSHTDSYGVVNSHVAAEHPEAHAHGAGAHAHDPDVDSEAHPDGWAPAHDAGDGSDEARARDAARAHDTVVDGELRTDHVGVEGEDRSVRAVGESRPHDAGDEGGGARVGDAARAHGAGVEGEDRAYDAGDEGGGARVGDAARAHGAGVEGEDRAHDMGVEGEDRAHDMGVEGEDRVHDVGGEGGVARVREVGAEGSNGAGELPASIGHSRDGRA
ncbi:hypothetical protein ACFQGX_10025 [Nonomuraea dietziae]|uniref:hypothetical protein n=1 Tax=Nonomuraea dietziae TaxID=65515 RepID=UPI003621973C